MIHIYGFRKKCVPFIESGRKVSTIRLERKDGRIPRPGDTLRLYVGLRGKSCRLIRETKNFKFATLFLQKDGSVWFQNHAHGDFLSDEQKEKLAFDEGFGSFTEMFDYFRKEYELPFHGIWVNWS